jgi:hypothetical protein
VQRPDILPRDVLSYAVKRLHIAKFKREVGWTRGGVSEMLEARNEGAARLATERSRLAVSPVPAYA